MRTRFAPSPTGDLHLGGAYIALASWLTARSTGGQFVIRVEDLDAQRTVPGAVGRILGDLTWLGLDWDEGPDVGGPCAPYVQSERLGLYEEAMGLLAAAGRVYPCTCSRTEIARVASAPHVGEEGPAYPGTCRDPARRRSDRQPALRFRIPDDPSRRVTFVDGFYGPQEQDVSAAVGDFVLRRADGQFSYQLAVTVDDLAMEVSAVIRGDDLLPSTGRQLMLARFLGGIAPTYIHLPMVLGPDGERLAKRHQSRWAGSTVRELRDASLSAGEVLCALGEALGLLAVPAGSSPVRREPHTVSPGTLLDAMRTRPIRPPKPWPVPADWMRPR